MTGWVEVVLVAFGAQLAVLPGEKVQFIIAALSTRYSPWLVVAAAGSAFAGWTALEVLLGGVLASALPAVYLDALTAGLFFFFAAMLVRSVPDGDGSSATTDDGVIGAGGDLDASVLGYEVPDRLGGFLPIFAMMAAGEFGDKTQLVTIGLAAQYGAHPGVWVGEMLAIVPVSLANALFFNRFSGLFDARRAHLAGAAIFLFFGLDTALAVATGVSVWETAVGAAADALLAIGAV